jgi:hypothetical protein
VDQKYRTRLLTDQFIVFTDAKGFTGFIKSMDVEQVEGFLLECDDLVNSVCEQHHGIVRQVNGDQYFLTFSKPAQTFLAIQEMCEKWKYIVENYNIGLSIGVHKGDLKSIRSFVYGDDIYTTIYLSEFTRFYASQSDEITVITSRKIIDEFKGLIRDNQCQELDGSHLTQEKYKAVFQEHGAYRLQFDR